MFRLQAGPGAFIDVPNNANNNFGFVHPMSVELWAYRIGSSIPMHFVGKRVACDVTQFSYQMAFDVANGLQFSGSSGGGVFTHLPMPMFRWIHLAATFDGSTFKFYTNGVLAATGSGTLGPPNTADLIIGGSGACEFFDGLIDEVSIYNRALAPAEVPGNLQCRLSRQMRHSLNPPLVCPACRGQRFAERGICPHN